ncbi:tyrosine recombinase XerD [Clostridium sp. 19966]|uniref:site-specific tyrosine recombinase n=1 Tax=Clostridium sp. 19966 TaxID=2768166 RepID=UPI0028E0937E|nr:site-specific tyrosine recombinase [Clostridium sp. 19966]MDT8716567.1 tyrosine recombinase XerD [Clostridium sp. 19966]
MNELVDEYLVHICKNKNLSDNTIEAYKRDLDGFSRYLTENKCTFFNADDLTIKSYIQFLESNGKKQSSLARSIVCIRNFYKYLLKDNYIEKLPSIDYELPKAQRCLPEILTVEEVNKLLCSPDTSTIKGIRDKAMLELMYATGVKITDMLNLNIEDVNLEFQYVRFRNDRGVERIVPIGKYAVEWIKKYMDVRHLYKPKRNDIIFLNIHGEIMTRQGFWKIVKYYAELSKIQKPINLYTLRHSVAVHMIENGADIKTLQELMGYKDISAVQIYLDIISQKKMLEVYKKSHPRA